MHLYKCRKRLLSALSLQESHEPWGKGPDEIIGMGGYQAAHVRETTVKSSK